MDIIKKLRESGNKLLQTEAEDMAKWSKLRHSKADLELFLAFNIAEIEFKGSDGEAHSVVCTSSTPFINVFKALKAKDKAKFAKTASSGIKTNKMDSVMSWDLVDCKMKTISLKSWQIKNFISISKDNILVLDQVIRNILAK